MTNSNFNDRRRVTLPHDASLTDDRSTSDFPVMGVPTGADIVGELVARSGHPEVGMLVARHVTEGRCETCQLTPYEAVQEGHPYVPIADRVPGVHPTVDDPDRAPRNYDPATDAPGQVQTDIDDAEINSGRAAARFRQSSSRWVPYQPGEGPFPGPGHES